MVKYDYKEMKSTICDNATTFDIESDECPKGCLMVVNRISAKDDDNAPTSIEIGVKRGAGIIWMEGEYSVTAARWYWTKEPVYLVEFEKIIVRFNGATSSDNCHASFLGYKDDQKGPKGPVPVKPVAPPPTTPVT